MQHAIMEDEWKYCKWTKSAARPTDDDQKRGREGARAPSVAGALLDYPGVGGAVRDPHEGLREPQSRPEQLGLFSSLLGVWQIWLGDRDGLWAAPAGEAGWRRWRLRGRGGTAKRDVSEPSWYLSSPFESSTALTMSPGLRSVPRGVLWRRL